MQQLSINQLLVTKDKLLDIQERIFGESPQEKIKMVVFDRKLRTSVKFTESGRQKGGKLVIDILDQCGIGFNTYECANTSCETTKKEFWAERFRFKPFDCKSILCLACRQTKIKKSIIKYEPYVKTFKNCYLLTLTYKNRDLFPRSFYSRMKDDFDNFRRKLKPLGVVISNYVKAIETKQSSEKGYHPHWHALIEIEIDKYGMIPLIKTIQERDGNTKEHVFSKVWQEVTGDSYIVNCVPVGGTHKDALNYVFHYMKKVEFESASSYVDYCSSIEGLQVVSCAKKFKPKNFKLECKHCQEPMRFTGFSNEIIIPAYPEQEVIQSASPEEFVFEDGSVPTGMSSVSSALARIKPSLDISYNAEFIEQILTKQEVDYLLRIGDIYESRPGEYRRL